MISTRQHPGAVPTALLHLLANGICLTIDQIEVDLGVSRRQVSDAASKLASRGYLERHHTGCYQLTPTGLQAAAEGLTVKSGPRRPHGKARIQRDTLRERTWRAMRVRQTFTLSDLVSDAAREGEKADNNVERYVRFLRQAGFVREAGRMPGTRPGSNGFRIYTLVRNTGPLAPVIREQRRLVRDQNTGEDVPCSIPS